MRIQLGVLTLCLLILMLANVFPRQLSPHLELRAAQLRDFGWTVQAQEAYLLLSQRHPAVAQWDMDLIDTEQLSAEQFQQRFGERLYELSSRDATLLALGYASLLQDKNAPRALDYFRKVSDRRLAGLSYLSGLAWKELGQEQRAVSCWYREIEDGGWSVRAVRQLDTLYIARQDEASVRALERDPLTGSLVSDAARQWLAYREGRWGVVAACFARRTLDNPVPAIAASLLIAGMWIVIFRRIDIFEPEPLWALLAMFALGCCSCLWLQLPLLDFINTADWRPDTATGAPLINTDLAFAIFHVGMLEELIKLVPVILFALVSRQFSEPLDWMIYGSLSALAFSTLENINYFADSPAYGMLPRFILCVMGHMLYTGIICYTWTRMRHIRRHGPVYSLLATALAFVFASVLHGFYDFVPGNQRLLVGWLEAVLYGRMLSNALSHSPFFPNRPVSLERLRNEDLIESTGLLLLLIPYLWCYFANSTERANAFLVSNGWSYLLLLTYFSTVGMLTLTRQRELWLSPPDEDERRGIAQRCLQMLRSVLVVAGLQYILTQALDPLPTELALVFAAIIVGLFWVYFRGAFGGLHSPLQWISRRSSPPELGLAGFAQVPTPIQSGRRRSLLTMTVGPALLAAMMLSCVTLLGGGHLPLTLSLIAALVVTPLAWVRPQFAAAWRHPDHRVWVWVFHNGRVLLWSRLPEGQLLTAAWLSPWRVKPRRVRLQLFPQATLEQLLEQHLRVSDLQPLRGLEQDLGEYVSSVQAAFLAAPLRSTLRAAWMTLTRQRRFVHKL